MKYDLGRKASGMWPSIALWLRFSMLMPELSNCGGMLPEKLLPSRFSVARTGIFPRETGIGPERRFIERSKSARREPAQPAYISREPTGELVSDQVNDSEERQGSNALRDGPTNPLPIRYSEAGKPLEFTNLRRNRTGHEPGFIRENRVLRFASEVNVGDSVNLRVTTHSIPPFTTVFPFPRLEYPHLEFMKPILESQQRRPVRRRARFHAGDHRRQK
nr:hypothetical protein GLYMA_15G032900 [Ipomoea batatas]GMD14804.1 hypothetical protein GLYMA_15G032900 [Ipomoea batatas]